MQVKKQEVTQKLLDSAKKEFFEKGYEKATIRAITTGADVALGNFYNYYANKEEIFISVLNIVYLKILEIINTDFDAVDYPLDKIVKGIIDIYYNYTVECSILMNKSKGSPYENVVDELVLLVEQRLRREFEKGNIKKELIIDDMSYKLLSSSILSGVMVLTSANVPPESFKTHMIFIMQNLFKL